MIKTALHRTQWNQRLAARLLNLNSSTLNAKVKQYDIKPLPSQPHDGRGDPKLCSGGTQKLHRAEVY